MKYILFLISFFTIISCQSKNNEIKPLYLAGIDEVSPEFRAKILNALQDMNADASGEVIAMEPRPGLRPLFILKMQDLQLYAHATYHDHHCRIEVDEDNTSVNNNDPTYLDLRYVLLHEIGHCYGHKHSADVNSLMYESFSGSLIHGAMVVEARISDFLNSMFN